MTALPRTLTRLVHRSGGSALANARSAALSLTASISDRTELSRLLMTATAAPGPGGALVAMPPEECVRLLAGCSLGRLAYLARAGVPDIVPVNYVLDGDDVLIRSGPGPKLQAAERRELVAFEVDRLDDDARTGWSVVVHGLAERVSWREQQQLDAGSPWASGPRHHVIRVTPRRITGRRLQGARANLPHD